MADPKVAEFYDEFSEYQKKIAYNERHFLMLDYLLDLGLESSSNVLELGCGIGIISSLILKVVRKGELWAVDISPKSIEIAEQGISKKNAKFFAGDVTEMEFQKKKFDYVTLFDVLEHIPEDNHERLFKTLSEVLTDSGVLVINIPTKRILDYFHRHHAEQLQIIDQPIETSAIIENARKCELRLTAFKEYGLWYEEETRFMVFQKNDEFVLKKRQAPKTSLKRRIQNKLETYW